MAENELSSVETIYEEIEELLPDLGISCTDKPITAVVLYSCHVGDMNSLDVVLQNLRVGDVVADCVNDGGDYGLTALMRACQEGHEDCVKRLLNTGKVEVNAKLEDDATTALMMACTYGHVPCLDLLLEVENLQLNAQDKNGLTALRRAMTANQTACVMRLLDRTDIDPNGRDINGSTALMKACIMGNVEWVESLLNLENLETDINARNKKGWTALMHACHKGHSECVDLLVAECVLDVNAKEENGVTALIFACKDDHRDCIDSLLKSDLIEVNVRSDDGISALDMTCYMGSLDSMKLLLQVEGINVNGEDHSDQNGGSVLTLACQNGLVECVELLIQFDVTDVNAMGHVGLTPLMAACKNGHVRCVELLLEAGGIEVNTFARELPGDECWEEKGTTALMCACFHGSTQCVARLLDVQGVCVNAQNAHDWTALMMACYQGNEDCVKLLLGHGSISIDNVNARNDDGNTALACAVSRNNVGCLGHLVHLENIDYRVGKGVPILIYACLKGYAECVSYFLKIKDIDVNAVYEGWANALMAACRYGNAQCVEILLEFDGIDVNIKNEDDLTSLMLAADGGFAECVRLLVHAADFKLHAISSSGMTALMYACSNTNDTEAECAKCILLRASQTDPVEMKAGVNTADEDGMTALHQACMNGHAQCVRLLCEIRDVEVNTVDNRGRSPLMDASQWGYSDCVNWLTCREDIDINAKVKDENEMTVLMLACESGSDNCVDVLLKHVNSGLGLDVNASNSDGLTALMIACKYDYVECVDLLVALEETKLNVMNRSNEIALSIASEYSQECMDRLLKVDNVDVNCRNLKMETPLIIASRSGMIISEFFHNIKVRCKTELNARDCKGRTFVHHGYMARNVNVSNSLFSDVGINIVSKDGKNVTLLMLACLLGDLKMLQRIAPQFDDLDTQDKNGWTALMYAGEHGDPECMKHLYPNGGIDVKMVNHFDRKGISVFMLACLEGNTPWIDATLAFLSDAERADVVNQTGNKEKTALMLAASAGHAETVSRLLQVTGINVNALDSSGNSALMLACRNGHRSCVDRLLPFVDGFSVNLQNKQGWTSLMLACRNGHSSCVRRLLLTQGQSQSGAPCALTLQVCFNFKSNEGLTARKIAKKYHRVQCSDILAEFVNVAEEKSGVDGDGGIEPETQFLGSSASKFHSSVTQDDLKNFCSWGHVDKVVSMLSRHHQPNIDVNFRYVRGKTALMFASEYGQVACVDVLVQHWAIEIDAVDRRGWTALMHASWNGNTTCLDRLLAMLKANANARDVNKATPLMLACLKGHTTSVARLLREDGVKASLHLQDNNGWDALMYASENGSTDCMHLLLNTGLVCVEVKEKGNGDLKSICCKVRHTHDDKNVSDCVAGDRGIQEFTRDNRGMTAFMRACLFGHVKMVDAFLQIYSRYPERNINERNDDDMSPLMLASLANQGDVVDCLLFCKGIMYSNNNRTRETALELACMYDNPECVRRLVDFRNRGFNQTFKQGIGEEARAALIACWFGYAECLDFVLQSKSLDRNCATQEGYSGLMAACMNGHVSCVERLLAADVDVNARDRNGRTALIFACENGNSLCVDRLVKAENILVDASDKHGQTALMLACADGHDACVKRLLSNQLKTVTVTGSENESTMYKHNDGQDHVVLPVDVNAKSESESCALLFACQNGHTQCVRYLLDVTGIDVNAMNDISMTPLILACAHGHEECVRLLVASNESERNSDCALKVNAKGKDGMSTALHAACQNGHVACVKFLLRAEGIDVNASLDSGVTPAMVACAHGHANCLELLLQFHHSPSDDGEGVNSMRHTDEVDDGDTKCDEEGGGDTRSDDNDVGSGSGDADVENESHGGAIDDCDVEGGDDGDDGGEGGDDGGDGGEGACGGDGGGGGVNVNATRRDWISPLSLACMQGHVQCMRLLVQYESDLEIADDACGGCVHSILQAARDKGYSGCADILEAVLAKRDTPLSIAEHVHIRDLDGECPD